MGERHFDTMLDRLERKYGVHAELVRPRVAYRETLREGRRARASTRNSPAAGASTATVDPGRPLPAGRRLRVRGRHRGRGDSREFIPAVDKGVQEAMMRGVFAGYPLVDFKVECFDGSYHDVDSNEMSFKLAGILAFRNVTPKARPVLLEPLTDVEVWTPDDVLGDVMGDLSSRRGQILGTEQDGRLTKVRAVVPEAELYKYSTTLHSITHGRGTHRQKFHGYAEAPPEVSAKVAAENQKERELVTA